MQVRTEEMEKDVLDFVRTDKEYIDMLYETVEKLKQYGYKITEYKIVIVKETSEFVTYRLSLKFESGFVFEKHYKMCRVSTILLKNQIALLYMQIKDEITKEALKHLGII